MEDRADICPSVLPVYLVPEGSYVIIPSDKQEAVVGRIVKHVFSIVFVDEVVTLVHCSVVSLYLPSD